MTKTLIVGAAALVMLATSCMKSAGPVTTEDRTVSQFNSVTVEGSANLFITQDNEYQVRIEAGEKLMPYLTSRVINGNLVFSEKRNSIGRNRTVNIYVAAHHLNELTIEGSGDIVGTGFTTDYLQLNIDGSGDMDVAFENGASEVRSIIRGSGDMVVEGLTDTVVVEIDGSGNFNGRYLKSAHGNVMVRGSGDVQVWTINSIKVFIDGSGNVEYWGNPASEYYDIKGSGDAYRR